jgi:hypothetical protein
MANAPLIGTGWGGYTGDLGLRKTRIFFQRGLDTKSASTPVGQISACYGMK